MATMKATIVNGETLAIAGNLAEIPVSELLALVPSDFNKAGGVLMNDRGKFLVPCEVNGVQKHVEYTISTFITREPLNDEEKAKCAGVAATQAAKKKEREEKEAAEREQIAKRNLSIGQQSVVDAMRLLTQQQQQTAQAAALVSKLTGAN